MRQRANFLFLTQSSMMHSRRSTSHSRRFVASVIISLLCFALPCSSQNLLPSDKNGQFFPEDVESNSQFCSIPPFQNKTTTFSPHPVLCANVTDDILLDDAAIQRLAEAYAPYLYFHPRERYTMSSVESTFGDVRTLMMCLVTLLRFNVSQKEMALLPPPPPPTSPRLRSDK